jgi:hypothetical protein
VSLPCGLREFEQGAAYARDTGRAENPKDIFGHDVPRETISRLYLKPARPVKIVDLNQMQANDFVDNPSRRRTFVTFNGSCMLFLMDLGAF